METILITGGAGFVGSHTCVELLIKGYRVILVDSFVNSSPIVIEKINKIISNHDPKLVCNLKHYIGDIRDFYFLKKVFMNETKNNKSIKAVIHFAGLKSVYESTLYPLKYWEVNVGGTISLLKVLEEFGCKKMIFSSSATIYSPNCISPIGENQIIKPINPYGETKAVIESLLDNFYSFNKNKISVASLRYFNPIGAHNSGLLGESPVGKPNNIFPLINKVAIGDLKEIQIYGKDWPTVDGTGVRDFIHVMDVADGHLKTLDYLFKVDSQNLKLNIGTGKGTSVLKLIHTYEEVNKVKIPYVFSSRRKGDSATIFADNLLSKRLLKWTPNRSLRDMCIDGWNWQLKN